MKRSGIATILMFLATMAFVPMAGAAGAALSGNALKDLVTGKRIYLQTPFGGEFPLRYNADGTVKGDGTALGLGKFLAPKETGKWWVKGDNLCQKWPTWYKGRTTCFTIEKTGPGTIKWFRDDGKVGTARVGN